MPDREKLAAILRKTEINKINGHSVLAEVCFTPNVFERMADHLIANGVVVREKGEWIEHFRSYGTPECPVCGWRIPYSEDSDLDARNFCPNCGADMRKGEPNHDNK